MTSTSTDRRQGLYGSAAVKLPCRVATTANITLSGLQAIDGVTVAADDRVLVWNQTTASQNGIYEADTGAWTRARDFDGSNDCAEGTLVFVAQGSSYGDSIFQLTTSSPVIGTSSLTFGQLGGGSVGTVSTYTVASKADLAALTDRPNLVISRYRSSAGDGGGGTWTFRTGDQSANVTADTQGALWVAPSSASTGASGAWQRIYSGMPSAAWWGAVGDNSTDNLTAGNAIVAFINATGGYVYWPSGAYRFSGALTTITSYGGGIVGAGRGNVGEVAGDYGGATGTVFRSTFASGTLLTVSGARQFHLSDISFWPTVFRGFGSRTTNTFELRIAGYQCSFERLKFNYCGTPVIFYDAINCEMEDVYFFATWGPTCVLATGTSSPNSQGVILENCQSFQPWQVSEPAAADIITRANTTAYTAGKKWVGNSGIWEVVTGGTTGSTAPTVPAYTASSGSNGPLGATITDGTVAWAYIGHSSLRGVQVDSYSQEIWMRGCQFLTCYNSVAMTDTAAAGSSAPFNLYMTDGCLADHCVGDSIYLSAGSGFYSDDLLSNYSAAGCGVRVTSSFVSTIKMKGGLLGANALHGFHADAGDDYEFDSVDAAGNSVLTADTYFGFKFAGIDGVRARGGKWGPIAGYATTQAKGFDFDASCTRINVAGVDALGNTLPGANASGFNETKRITDCLGFITENSGTGTVNSGATTAVITHGLSGTPTLAGITIVFGEQGTNDYGRWSVGTITSTQFTLTVAADPGASNLDFGWRASLNA